MIRHEMAAIWSYRVIAAVWAVDERVDVRHVRASSTVLDEKCANHVDSVARVLTRIRNPLFLRGTLGMVTSVGGCGDLVKGPGSGKSDLCA